MPLLANSFLKVRSARLVAWISLWGAFIANTRVFEYFPVCIMALVPHSVIIFIISHLFSSDFNFAHIFLHPIWPYCAITFGTLKKQYVVCATFFLPFNILPNAYVWSTRQYCGLNHACPWLGFVLLQQCSHFIFQNLAQYCAYGC